MLGLYALACFSWHHMQKVSLEQVVEYLDRLLQIDQIQDWPEAHNGLQVENPGQVTRIAAAVDVNLTTLHMAIDAGADLLLVHHGLFWSRRIPWCGTTYRILRLLLDHGLAVYSAHLPLDIHPELGNNAQLCRALGLEPTEPFLYDAKKQCYLGLKATVHRSRQALIHDLQRLLGMPPRLLPHGPETCRSIGVVTGSAGSALFDAAAEGIDTFLTGEGPHWTFSAAEELGINVIYAGHYLTETLGVRALAAHLAEHFQLPWIFLDHPSGL